jgi:hypothetical protein
MIPARMALASLPAWQRAGRVVPRARRFGGWAHTADRHCGQGAQAIDRALALRKDGGNTGWRPRSGRRQQSPHTDRNCHRHIAGGDAGSATVFFFGDARIRRVASRRGYASA